VWCRVLCELPFTTLNNTVFFELLTFLCTSDDVNIVNYLLKCFHVVFVAALLHKVLWNTMSNSVVQQTAR